MKNFFRDKTRDNLAKDLNSSGIKAEMAERGRFEEKLRSSRRYPGRNVPLGVIDITGEKIPWINVIRSVNRGKNNPPRHRIVFGIRDDSLPKGHEAIEIKMIRKKSVPLIGKVVDVQWEGKESLLPLTKALNDDIELKELVKDMGNLEVHSHSDIFHGWTIELDRTFKPTKQNWESILKIVEHLTLSPRPG